MVGGGERGEKGKPAQKVTLHYYCRSDLRRLIGRKEREMKVIGLLDGTSKKKEGTRQKDYI